MEVEAEAEVEVEVEVSMEREDKVGKADMVAREDMANQDSEASKGAMEDSKEVLEVNKAAMVVNMVNLDNKARIATSN